MSDKFYDGSDVPIPTEPRHQDEIISDWGALVNIPLVSIVCHTFNHKPFIRKALNSFLMQRTTFPFEIIVNDDSSVDGTTEIVKEYQNRYPKIIRAVFHDENQFSQGVSPRNFSFPRVRGKYIALCEGDDYWISSDKIQAQIEAFEPGVSIVFHNSLTVADEKLLDSSYYPVGREPIRGYTANQMARGCKIPTASALFISKPFQKEKHENIVNGDHLMWATLASHGSAKFLQKTYSVYRYHPGGVWSSRSVVDKIEPILRSKKVIFECVDMQYKTSAMLGFCGTTIGLVNQLAEEKNQAPALALLSSLYLQVIKMLPQVRIYKLHNIKDIILIIRTLGLRVPIIWIKIRMG